MDNKGCIKCGSTEAGQKEIATNPTRDYQSCLTCSITDF